MKGAVITLAVLAFASPAMAMDYVKCEAMQKAMARVTLSRKEARNNALRADMDAQKFEQCGETFLPCAGYVEDHQRKIAAGDAAVVTYDERLAKIQTDYTADGCY